MNAYEKRDAAMTRAKQLIAEAQPLRQKDVLFLRLCKAFSPSQKQRVLLRVNDSEALVMRKELREKLTALFRQAGKP